MLDSTSCSSFLATSLSAGEAVGHDAEEAYDSSHNGLYNGYTSRNDRGTDTHNAINNGLDTADDGTHIGGCDVCVLGGS